MPCGTRGCRCRTLEASFLSVILQVVAGLPSSSQGLQPTQVIIRPGARVSLVLLSFPGHWEPGFCLREVDEHCSREELEDLWTMS